MKETTRRRGNGRAHLVARPRSARGRRVPLTLLEVQALSAASSADLPPEWACEMARMPVPVLRAALAGRSDLDPTLLDLLSRDLHPKVRSAAAANPALPLPVAVKVAGTVQPYGALAVAARPDCPDEVAAALLSVPVTLNARKSAAWERQLRNVAAGLAGKPAAQRAAVAACFGHGVPVPDALLVVCEADLQTQLLAQLLAAPGLLQAGQSTAAAVRWLRALRGTPAQREMVRAWLDIPRPSRLARPSEVTGAWAEVGSFWADPCTPDQISAMTAPEYARVAPGVRAIAAGASAPDRLAVAVAGARRDPRVAVSLRGNPHVDQQWVRTQLAADPCGPTDPGRDLSADGCDDDFAHLPAGSPGRALLHARPVDACLDDPAVRAAVGALLGTDAWPLLGQLWDQPTSASIGALVLTAAAASEIVLPDDIYQACAAAPAQAPAQPTPW